MVIFYRYLRHYWKLVAAALGLAAINQVFSLLDPLIFRHIIDSYATRYREYSSAQFLRGVSVLLGAAVGVAFVSRVAKNFQDYFVNVITQQVGARIYADGVRHSLELPYTLFEDQRSGETLGKLQKVRTDVERFISLAVNMVFTTLIGLVFVMIYASCVHWSVAPAYLLTVPLLGGLSSVLSRKIKEVQKHIVRETTALAGATTESLRNIELVKSLGLAQQEIARLNTTTAKILKLELKKVRYLRSLSFVQGTCVNLLRTSILFLMLYLIFTQRITVGQFFSLFIYSFFIFGPLQELGNVINVYRETEVSLQNFEAILKLPPEPRPEQPVTVEVLETLRFDNVSFQHQSASTPALSGISFQVRRGETVAFVGPSGAGKISWPWLGPTCVLLHIDQPHRTFDGRTASNPRRALVWAGKSIPRPSAHRPMDLSDLAIRFCHGSHRLRVSKILYSVSCCPGVGWRVTVARFLRLVGFATPRM